MAAGAEGLMPKQTAPEIARLHDRCVVDPDAFDAWLQGMGWAWQPLSRGEYGVSLEEAQLLHVCQDPALWCRAFMDEPDTGEPYNFWPYQRESIDGWDQDGIHQDGAEVGKTREITALILWGQCTGFGYSIRNPSVLVAAPQQTHLDEIIMAIEAHVGEGEGSEGPKPVIHRFWRKPRKHPHYMMRFKGPTCGANQLGTVYFRPAGYDGEAFRGVHVNAMALFDEAAKVKNKVCWSEFHRALKPGCIQRVYSVPDGDNTTVYYRMTQQAIPNLPKGQPGMRLFHWPKTLMPDPFWSEARKREFIKRYGSEDAPGYQRNVLGLHGQQENPVWMWSLLEKNIHDTPDYRVLKLLVNEAQGEIHATGYGVELTEQHGKKIGTERPLFDRYEDLDAFQDKATRRDEIRRLLRDVFAPVEGSVLWAGADLGFSNDPTEIFLAREIGSDLRDLVRIQARGLDYYLQCELIYCLDELFGFKANWGVDFGNAGTAVVQILQSSETYEDGRYDERMTGFQFAAVVDATDEEGNLLEEEDKHGDLKPVRLPAKELATNLITARFQRRGWVLPYDADVIGHFSNHTAREGSRHRIFDKHNDHTIDAKRALILRKVFNEQIGTADVFSSGVHRRDAA